MKKESSIAFKIRTGKSIRRIGAVSELHRSVCLCLLFCLMAAAGRSQDREILEQADIFTKFGTISPEVFSKSPGHSYPYEYLLNEASTRFEERPNGIVALIDHLVRIKVHSDDPIEIAGASLVGIPFYDEDNIERITHLEAVTHSPDGSKEFLDRESVRTMDLNSRYKILEFEMPDVEAGSVLEYKYTLERRYIEELPDFYLAQRVPTQKARFILNNEIFLRYETIPQNIDFEVVYTEEKIDTSSIPLVFTYQRPEPVFIQEWRAENIPAVDASAYISSADDIRGKLKFQMNEFGIPRQPLENSWDFVAAQIRRNVNPYQVLDEHPELMQMGEEIARQTDSLEAAQDSIFRLVNDRVQFNEESSIFAEEGLAHVLEGEPAGQADINMVLLAMLRGAWIEARPLYISGRDFGSINKLFPSLYQFNKMLVYSTINGQEYFMDAAFPESMPDLIPVESFNRQGLVLSENEYEWVEISPEKSLYHLDIVMNANLEENGSLTGTIEAATKGYPSRQIRSDVSGGETSEEIVKKTFFEVYPDTQILQGSVEIGENPDRVSLRGNFRIPEYAVTFSDGLEFRPMVVGYLFNNPFESAERKVPITLDAPETLSIQYNIELPAGFQMEESGESRSTQLQGAELSETYSASQNRLEYSFDIQITRKEFLASEYSQLRRMYERWVALSNDVWYIRN